VRSPASCWPSSIRMGNLTDRDHQLLNEVDAELAGVHELAGREHARCRRPYGRLRRAENPRSGSGRRARPWRHEEAERSPEPGQESEHAVAEKGLPHGETTLRMPDLAMVEGDDLPGGLIHGPPRAADAAGCREADGAPVSIDAHTWMITPGNSHQVRGRMGAVGGQHEPAGDLVAGEEHAERDTRCPAGAEPRPGPLSGAGCRRRCRHATTSRPGSMPTAPGLTPRIWKFGAPANRSPGTPTRARNRRCARGRCCIHSRPVIAANADVQLRFGLPGSR